MSARSGQARVRNDEVKYKAVGHPCFLSSGEQPGGSTGRKEGDRSVSWQGGGSWLGERPRQKPVWEGVGGEGTSAATDPLCAGLRAWEMKSGGRCDRK